MVAGADPHGVMALLDSAQAARHADRLLEPLDGAGAAGELLGTLRSWLAHHGNWDRTAADLGVHRNTVRHRLGQITRLLGQDLNDPDVRMELWFALRWRTRAR
ncbi:PucR family transcriptional regulator [Actinomadura sp. 1N219]|uniref:PucR family transcriptional regulator n=1 Tax=Actinomadura sp. 1N219 TaxID=3375152 RepID=UPI0037AECC45